MNEERVHRKGVTPDARNFALSTMEDEVTHG